jgi:hypothetical protein
MAIGHYNMLVLTVGKEGLLFASGERVTAL